MDKGPWRVWESDYGRAYIVSDDFSRDVSLRVAGDFETAAEKLAYCEWLAGVLNKAAERDEWQACALLAGEYCGDSVGPVGYYEFTPRQFKEWFSTTAAYKKPAIDAATQEKRDAT